MGSRSNDTVQQTEQFYTDSRQVMDAGGGVIGGGSVDNSLDASTTNNSNWTQFTDASTVWTSNTNQSDSSTKSYENSGNTTWNSDSSDRSTTNWTSNVVDGGAIKGMTEIGLAQAQLAGKIAQISSDNASMAAGAALKAQENALASASAANAGAIDFAKTNTAQAFKSVNDAIGFAEGGMSTMAKLTDSLIGSAQRQADQAAGTALAAYNSAADQANGNKTLVYVALAVVGLVGAVLIFKKG